MAYTTIPASTGGSGAVTSIVAGTGVTISGATGDVTVTNSAPFAADTIIALNNSVPASVSAWEHIITLTNSSPGTEASQAVIKLLSGGAQTTALTIGPAVVTFPGQTQVPVNATAYSFTGNATTGIGYVTGTATLNFNIGGITGAKISNGGILISSAGDASITRNGSGVMAVFSSLGILIGPNAAIPLAATVGYMQIPSCAGTPTGAPGGISGGGVPFQVDTTGGKIWAFYGAAWHFAVLTSPQMPSLLQLTPGTTIFVPGDSITAGFGTGVPWNDSMLHTYDGIFVPPAPRPAVVNRTAAVTNRAATATVPSPPGAHYDNYDPIWLTIGQSGASASQITANIIAPQAAALAGVWNLVVIIEAGTNDLGNYYNGATTLAQIRIDYDALIATIKAANPRAQIAGLNVMCQNIFSTGGEQYPDPNNSYFVSVNAVIAASIAAAGGILLDIRAAEQAHEQANNTPSPGTVVFDLTFDGTHPVAAGRTLMCGLATAAIAT